MQKIKLGDSATFINGYAFKPSDWKSEGLPIIRIQNLTGNDYETNYFNGSIPSKFYVKNGDILISWSGSLGVYEWNNGDAVLNQHIFKVIFNKHQVDKNYFKHLISKKINEMAALTHGATMKHITKGDFDNIEILLPDINVQQKIAARLDQADALRQKDRQLLNLYDELIKSVFIDMFGDPVLNAKDFDKVKVGEIVSEIKDGPHVSPKYSNAGVPILSTRNIRPYELLLDDVKYVSEETYQHLTRYFQPQKGDVLLTKGGTTGFAKVVDFDFRFCVWVHLAVLRPKSIVHAKYLEAALNSEYCFQQSQRFTHGIANRDLGLTRIAKIEMLLPPLSIQERFVEIVYQIEKQKGLVQQQIEHSEALFQRLLQDSFSN